MFMRGELPSGDGNDRGFDLKVQREAGPSVHLALDHPGQDLAGQSYGRCCR